ncbi:MAG: hypothetical protein EOO69_02925 [Moraxellaceae bacterium]|nr:MAG: hypothetical protein EOO69_02925 [Moraxellaceae bacterium]
MYKSGLFIIMLSLVGCSNDWLAKLGLGCFMEGKLCYDYFEYSNSVQKSLVLTLPKNIKYKIEEPFGKKDGTWIDCIAVKSDHTVCSLQVLKTSLKCADANDIVTYEANKWQLQFYEITLKENSIPPYIVNKIDNSRLNQLDILSWAKQQKINAKQEVLCS